MSDQNRATVPPHLLHSGIDVDEMAPAPITDGGSPDNPHPEPAYSTTSGIDTAGPAASSRATAKRSNTLQMAMGGVILFVLGGAVGSVIAHRGDNPVLATVNGVPIDRQQYTHRCETTIVNNAAVGPQVLRQMVNEELALQYAAKQGVTPSDTDVEAKYEEAGKSANFADNLKKSLQTPADVKHAVKTTLAQSAVITKGSSVSDEEVQKYYQANIDPKNSNARYYRPDAVQVAAIISDKEADIDNAIHDLATGAAFTEVARKYSKDKSIANGGVLPAIRRGQMNSQRFPGLENRLFSLKPNQQIDKIKVGNTYWLVRCIGRSQESTVPFEKVKEECRQGALLVKGDNTNGQAVQKDYQDFVKNADIKALQPQYHDAVNVNGK
jgi:parvulin-like peptidyl-prolyl isomerase